MLAQFTIVLIDGAHVLEALFDHVLIPFAVRDELLHTNAPKKVQEWLARAKPWLETSPVPDAQPIRGLHRGENEALQPAMQVGATAILIDDLDGRTAARRLGLGVIGTVAILELPAEKNLLDLPNANRNLRKSNFFAPPELLDAALVRDQHRRPR